MKLPIQYRAATIDSGSIDKDNRTVDVSFSCETPVKRGFGNEILGHNPGEVRMDRLKNSAPVLHNHDPDEHVGVVQDAQIRGGKGLATLRFARDPESDKHFQHIADGIKPNVSVGYQVHAVKLVKSTDDAGDTYRVTDWEPHEISTVAMPLDHTVGVGRADSGGELFEVLIVDNPELEKRSIDAQITLLPQPKRRLNVAADNSSSGDDNGNHPRTNCIRGASARKRDPDDRAAVYRLRRNLHDRGRKPY